MARTVECFYPGKGFPAISITGASCALNCKHCSRKYLEGMIPATTPGDLLEVAEALAERGASGFLLSGGADSTGRVRMAGFADAISEIKSTTDLRINAHIGLATKDEIERLVKSGIDSFSVDVYGSDETIREVLGLNATTEDYLGVVKRLMEAGADIVAPHICVGVHAGKLKGEFAAVESLRKLETRALILISLIPTKGTEFQSVAAPDAGSMISVVKKAREELPAARLLLGCMRSKLDRSPEFDLVTAGLDGIVLPASATVDRLKDAGYSVKKRSVCCSLV